MKPSTDEDRAKAFRASAEGEQRGGWAEFFHFLRHNKKWWLTPILVLLFLLGALVMLSGTGVAPFIYSLF